jgi:hypothetical protein
MKKANLFEKLAEFMLAGQTQLPGRLLKETIELGVLRCSKAEYGEWIAGFELPVLIEVLNSSDRYFHRSFPGLESFDGAKRKTLANELEMHASTCPRCSRKVIFDLAWEKEVDAVIFQNRGALRMMFESDGMQVDTGSDGCCRSGNMGLH